RRLGLGLDLRLRLRLSPGSRLARPRVGHIVVALDPELVVERRDGGLEPLEKRVVQRLLLLDLLDHAGALALEEADESRLPLAVSRSDANWANAASSRYWARSSRIWPATWRMALVCASPPTRETLMPTFSAGRWPALNRSDCR